jgi:hypothetical protein
MRDRLITKLPLDPYVIHSKIGLAPFLSAISAPRALIDPILNLDFSGSGTTDKILHSPSLTTQSPTGHDDLMLKWPDVLNLAKTANPAPDRKVVKTDAEWRRRLRLEE